MASVAFWASVASSFACSVSDFELLACMFGRKFYECGRRPHAGHLLDKIEGGIGVLVSEFEELIVVVLHTLNRSQITVLDEVGRFSRGDTHFLVRFFGLGGTLFSHFSECLRSACLRTGGLCVHIHEAIFPCFLGKFSIVDSRRLER